MPVLTLNNTRPIFKTNFSGDPARDNFGSSVRKLNVILPPDQVDIQAMIDDGFNVKQTRPDENGNSEFYISATLNFDSSYPPVVELITGQGWENKVVLDADSVKACDMIRVARIDCELNIYNGSHHPTLYVKTMQVYQDTSTLGCKYSLNNNGQVSMNFTPPAPDDLPFN